MFLLHSLIHIFWDSWQDLNDFCKTCRLEWGFPRAIESIEKALNCEIGFQDLEKVLNLAKIYIRN